MKIQQCTVNIMEVAVKSGKCSRKEDFLPKGQLHIVDKPPTQVKPLLKYRHIENIVKYRQVEKIQRRIQQYLL